MKFAGSRAHARRRAPRQSGGMPRQGRGEFQRAGGPTPVRHGGARGARDRGGPRDFHRGNAEGRSGEAAGPGADARIGTG
eukprot:9170520-Pyramimonas_sp.AAC.1